MLTEMKRKSNDTASLWENIQKVEYLFYINLETDLLNQSKHRRVRPGTIKHLQSVWQERTGWLANKNIVLILRFVGHSSSSLLLLTVHIKISRVRKENHPTHYEELFSTTWSLAANSAVPWYVIPHTTMERPSTPQASSRASETTTETVGNGSWIKAKAHPGYGILHRRLSPRKCRKSAQNEYQASASTHQPQHSTRTFIRMDDFSCNNDESRQRMFSSDGSSKSSRSLPKKERQELFTSELCP